MNGNQPENRRKTFGIYEQVLLILLYEVLKSKDPFFQMPQISEKYQVALQNWNKLREHRTVLYNRVSAQFDALLERGLIVTAGQDLKRVNYKIAVKDEAERISETIRLFDVYIDKLQDEIAINEGKDLIFSEKLLDEMLLYHAEDIYDDYFEDPAAM